MWPCVLLVGVLSGASSGAQQQNSLPLYQVIVKGDPEFERILNGLPALGMVTSLGDGSWPLIDEFKECGSTIAIILGVWCGRKSNGFEISPIGSLGAQETLSLGGKGQFPKGKYFLLAGPYTGSGCSRPQGWRWAGSWS